MSKRNGSSLVREQLTYNKLLDYLLVLIGKDIKVQLVCI